MEMLYTPNLHFKSMHTSVCMWSLLEPELLYLGLVA